MADRQASGARGFPTTHWSEIRRAAGRDPAAAREALEALLSDYSPALQAHLRHRWRLHVHEAEDLSQEFVTEKILVSDLLARADRRRGKFRTLLLTALDRFVIDHLRKSGRLPGHGSLEPEPTADGDVLLFDRVWAQAIIVSALRRMREDCKRKRQPHVWRIFFHRVVAPLVSLEKPPSLERLAGKCGLDSPKAAGNLLQTAKRKFRSHLLAEVAQFAQEGDAVESELLELCRILAKPDLRRTAVSFDAHSSIMNSKLWSKIEAADPDNLSRLLSTEDDPAPATVGGWLESERSRRAADLIDRYAYRMPLPHAPDADSLGKATVADLLRSRASTRDTLETIKRIYRHRSHNAAEPECNAAKVLYLATVAAALLAHDVLISKSRPVDMLNNWQLALQSSWLDDETRSLLSAPAAGRTLMTRRRYGLRRGCGRAWDGPCAPDR